MKEWDAMIVEETKKEKRKVGVEKADTERGIVDYADGEADSDSSDDESSDDDESGGNNKPDGVPKNVRASSSSSSSAAANGRPSNVDDAMEGGDSSKPKQLDGGAKIEDVFVYRKLSKTLLRLIGKLFRIID